MRRRDFLRTATALGASLEILGQPRLAAAENAAQPCTQPVFPQVPKLTQYVAEFVVNTKYSDIPSDVLELGKKSILDALGLALSGSKAETAGFIQEYVKPFDFHAGGVTVLGTAASFLRASPLSPTEWQSM